jgi:hypothetical protein
MKIPHARVQKTKQNSCEQNEKKATVFTIYTPFAFSIPTKIVSGPRQSVFYKWPVFYPVKFYTEPSKKNITILFSELYMPGAPKFLNQVSSDARECKIYEE